MRVLQPRRTRVVQVREGSLFSSAPTRPQKGIGWRGVLPNADEVTCEACCYNNELMMVSSTLKRQEVKARQEDFQGLPLASNGESRQVSPGAFSVGEDAPPPESEVTPIVPGALVVAGNAGEQRLAMNVQMEQLDNGSVRARFADGAATISFTFHALVNNLGNVNINTQYTGKPLQAALLSARFLELLATMPGYLFAESYEPIFNRFLVQELPIAVPEAKLREHRNRLSLLEELYEVWIDTDIEIRYPSQTDDAEGLNNLHFVREAVRGGWIAQPIAAFDTVMTESYVRVINEELEQDGVVQRAFVFDVPDESYKVFDTMVSLGPSRRYLSGAELVSSRKEIEDWLKENSDSENTLTLKWKPLNDFPMHVFFEDWPKSSLASVQRELGEFEVVYDVKSERFKQAWEQREPWTRAIQDASRWFSLIQASEELTEDRI